MAGFAVGNPYVDYWSGVGAQMEAYWDHQLIDQKSWSVYESSGCTSSIGFLNNSICSTLSLDFMKKIGSINPYALDYPVCLTTQQVYMLEILWDVNFIQSKSLRGTNSLTLPYEPCEDNWTENYLNIPEVKTALHVKDINWVECSRTTKYQLSDKMKSTIHIYRKLIEQSKTKLNIMIYSGDDDSVCATKYTNEWVYGLGYLISSNWKVWNNLDGQVAGYETIFKPASGNKFKFSTVHGAGHEVPTYKPAQAFVP